MRPVWKSVPIFAAALAAAMLSLPIGEALASPPKSYDIADLRALESAFGRLADTARPVAVSISAYRNIEKGNDRQRVSAPISFGAGFVLRADGYIVTNHHVIDGADSIEVTLSTGVKHGAELVQYDPRSDLAVIRVPASGLTPARFGDLDRIRVGQWAFTVGNPFGLAQRDGLGSFSMGVVSAVGRSLTDRIDGGDNDRYYGNLIETDASINPGNSGGPLFNLDGEVIGVATAMITDSGVDEGRGFAIPISKRTRGIIETLARGEPVRYGYLGVTIVTADRQQVRELGLPSTLGALVKSVDRDNSRSPAALAGIRANDFITEFDGSQVRDHDELIRLVGSTPVGSEVAVRLIRDRRPQTVKLTLAERMSTVAARSKTGSTEGRDAVRFLNWRGAILVEPTDSFLAANGLDRDKAGIFVLELERDSVLHRRGLRESSLIVRCNDRRVRTLDELKAADDSDPHNLRLEVRDGPTLTLRK